MNGAAKQAARLQRLFAGVITRREILLVEDFPTCRQTDHGKSWAPGARSFRSEMANSVESP